MSRRYLRHQAGVGVAEVLDRADVATGSAVCLTEPLHPVCPVCKYFDDENCVSSVVGAVRLRVEIQAEGPRLVDRFDQGSECSNPSRTARRERRACQLKAVASPVSLNCS